MARVRADAANTQSGVNCYFRSLRKSFFIVAATLAAKQGSPPITNLLVSVNRLTNNNLMQNADGGPGGVGALLTIPKGLDPEYVDGILTHPENIRNIPFTICLSPTNVTRFTFLVDVLGAIGQ
jgi:hypothetical protein